MSQEQLEEIKSVSEFQIDNGSHYGRPANVILNGDDVKWLIKQAERVQELEELKSHYMKQIQELTHWKDDLTKQNKRYREALEFYADEKKYFVRLDELELPEDILHANPRITYDRGQKARETLKETNT